jgi:HEPN domain-containing protein
LSNLKTTKLWFKIAIRDLKNSKALIDMGATHKHAAAYHAQQCAEKSIKGFLTHHSCRVAKTHDLEELAKLVIQFDKSLTKLILKYKFLTDLAIVYRYPDAEKKPLTFAKAKSAVKAAHIIYDSFYKATFNKSDNSKFMKSFL